VFRSRSIQLLSAVLGLSLLFACGGGGGGTSTPPAPPAATLTAITVSPTTFSLAKSATRQLSATGAYSDGTSKDVTASVTWSSGAPAVASISTGGLVTGLASGPSTLTAVKDGVTGSSTVTVTTPTLTALAVTPTLAVVSQRGSYTYTATGTFSDGTTSHVAATWSSADTSIATVDATTGMVTGGANYGQTTITASAGGFSAKATIINDYPVPTKLVITPNTPSVLVGATLKLTANVTWSDGTVTDASGPSGWSTSSAAIASIAGAGTVKGVASGTATITATFTYQSNTSGTTIVSGNTTLNVTTSSPLTSLTVMPIVSNLPIGYTTPLTATGTYADGHTANLSATATWTSSNTSAATVSASGTVTTHAAGTATITAAVGSITGTATINVSAAATLTSITVAPASQTRAIGATSQYTATGNYSNGTSQTPLAGVTWSTSSSAVATTDAFGLVSAVGAGSANIIATLGGVSGHGALTVTAPTQSFDSRLVGSWKWLGTPDLNGNSYGSFYNFYADGTFTYELIYLGSGVNCVSFYKVLAWHTGTFTSLGSLSDTSNAGKIIFTCTTHYTDYTSCGGSVSRSAWGGTNPHFHWAAFSDANHLVSNHSDDFLATGNIIHVRQ
jgi:uncharacterized protein YjdB